ncbi:hypothetical protein AB4Z50_14685 [Paenibacillus sp. 2TAB26]|uniref:hypothetical protein n=1 Tax=Paenibacillus sp. 2TAB26 TaxID=3233005 RepID=UPI003F9A7912
MEKLPLIIVLCIIVIGLFSWVYLSDDGINNSLTDGYDRLKTEVRTYGYKPGP